MSAPDFWTKATRELSQRDPILATLITRYKGEALATRGDAFYTLARAIAGQQISVKAADSVWRRIMEGLGEITPAAFLASKPELLRSYGLSPQKIRYLEAISAHFDTQANRVAQWPQLDDEALIKELVALKGVGRWTAEMLLIFHYLRPDIFPVADLGVLKAMSVHYNNGKPLTPQEALVIADTWRPWRTVSTWYLWRALDPVPVEY